MAQITYTDKVALNENASVNDINKVNASDMNEIKNVVNENAITLDNLVVTTSTTSDTNTYSCNYINNSDTYSTSEIKTNKVWINNKPIYRKVISGTFTGSGTESVSLGISDKIYPTKLEAILTNSASAVEDTSIPTLFVRGTSNQTLEYRGNVSGPFTAIIEYTK